MTLESSFDKQTIAGLRSETHPGKLSPKAHSVYSITVYTTVYYTGVNRFPFRRVCTVPFVLNLIARMFSFFSVVMQPQSQHHREPDAEDEREALQEPQVSLLVGLGSSVLLGLSGGLACPAAADLGENMHCCHIEESPGREEHSHTCRTELVLR